MALQYLVLLLVRETQHCRAIGQNKITIKRSQTTSGTIHLKRWHIFDIFDSYPPPIGYFLKFLTNKLIFAGF